MTIHINRFIDSITAHEARGQRDFSMSMRDAKSLHADITKLLLSLETLREQQVTAAQPIEVRVSGGSFKSA